MPYIPHTSDDVKEMLDVIGIPSSETLFEEIPSALLYDGFQVIPEGVNEMTMMQQAKYQASRNQNAICFLGAGSYEHYIPAAVWDIATRGEFLTAYTPYQAEASQGTLQMLYEFQTMIAELTALEVANASLYDGASALAEAVLMAIRIHKKKDLKIPSRILVIGGLHPFYLETLETILKTQHIELLLLPIDEPSGVTPLGALKPYENQGINALVIAQPNFFGCLEQVDCLTDWAADNQIISIASVNPTALGLLKPPGQWGKEGVDIACGEGQPLGVPMASGGPYFGFMSTKLAYVRHMPGRLVGRTTDLEGKEGFTLTLQAREQHIRRGKATSNICTNQGLLVTAASIYMTLLGAEGLAGVARQAHDNTLYLCKLLTELPGVEQVFSSPFFHEVLIRLPINVDDALNALQQEGLLGGYAPERHFPGINCLKNTLLICATEMRTIAEMEAYRNLLQALLSSDDITRKTVRSALIQN